MTKEIQMKILREEILEAGICSHLAQTCRGLVMGEGSLTAEVVFIGEAPGREEDQQGRPFVGASGRFLNEMLASINLKREDVYITNIVKYRPPENRDPTPEEKAAFKPYGIIVPLYHPAAALYNGGTRETHLEDFQKIFLALSRQ